MKKFLPILIALVTVSLCHRVTVGLVHADVALVVSPPSFDIEVKPGETIQKTIKITNSNKQSPIDLKVGVSDFIVEDDQGTPIIVNPEASGKYLASPWFSLESERLTLEKEETKTLSVVISVPEDALPGGHYSLIYFSPLESDKPVSTGPSIESNIGSLFSLTIAGDIKYDALIKEFDASQRLYEYGPIDFTATLENQSDTHITPIGKIVIKNMLGREVGELTLDKTNIFPFMARSFTAKWDQIWGLGRYSAELIFTYGSGSVASRVIEFWILPYRLLAAIAILLLALLGITISVRRHLKHKGDKRDGEIDELKRRIVELENQK